MGLYVAVHGSLVAIVNKPTKVTKNNDILIDYIITNSFMDQKSLTGILKTDISDHFPIFTISLKHRLDSSDKKITIRKRITNADSIQEFRDILSEVDWRTCIPYLTQAMPMNIS